MRPARIAVTRNAPLSIFNCTNRPYITTYDGWRAADGPNGFDPNAGLYLNRLENRVLAPRKRYPLQPEIAHLPDTERVR